MFEFSPSQLSTFWRGGELKELEEHLLDPAMHLCKGCCEFCGSNKDMEISVYEHHIAQDSLSVLPISRLKYDSYIINWGYCLKCKTNTIPILMHQILKSLQ
jgi:hypothetical protein